MEMKLKGLPELEQELAKLPNATGRNVLRRVGKRVMEPVADDAAQRAPDRTGILAFSIQVSEQRTRRAKRSQNLGDGAIATGGRSVNIAVGAAGGLGALYYAWFVEFGTVHMRSQPFLRPAWDYNKGKVLSSVKVELWSEITKAVGKMERKALRGLS
jgi:HK97 gp10 family phage protein